MLVVSDTSVLLNLAVLGEAGILLKLFGAVVAPPKVQQEFLRLARVEPRFQKASWPTWVLIRQPVSLPDELSSGKRLLDPGETEAIALALELKADVLLMDEEAGRAAAKSLGLNVTGIAGVLLRAKASGLVPAVAPLLWRLDKEAGFWIGETLRRQILQLAGEQP